MWKTQYFLYGSATRAVHVKHSSNPSPIERHPEALSIYVEFCFLLFLLIKYPLDECRLHAVSADFDPAFSSAPRAPWAGRVNELIFGQTRFTSACRDIVRRSWRFWNFIKPRPENFGKHRVSPARSCRRLRKDISRWKTSIYVTRMNACPVIYTVRSFNYRI